MKIAVDFDNTLSRTDVQDFIKSLMLKGVDVYICTFRMKNIDNSDLFVITDKLEIPREKIIFTEMENKSKFLDESFKLMLDDDHTVIYDLRANTKIPCIDVNKSSYKNKINRILGL